MTRCWAAFALQTLLTFSFGECISAGLAVEIFVLISVFETFILFRLFVVVDCCLFLYFAGSHIGDTFRCCWVSDHFVGKAKRRKLCECEQGLAATLIDLLFGKSHTDAQTHTQRQITK